MKKIHLPLQSLNPHLNLLVLLLEPPRLSYDDQTLKLIAQIESGDESARAKLNELNKDGFAFIHLAAKDGRVDLIEKLLASGGDVNCKSSRDATAIYLAVLYGKRDAVKQLLKLDHININIRCRGPLFNLTPFQAAVKTMGSPKNAEIIRMICQKQRDVKEEFRWILDKFQGDHNIIIELLPLITDHLTFEELADLLKLKDENGNSEFSRLLVGGHYEAYTSLMHNLMYEESEVVHQTIKEILASGSREGMNVYDLYLLYHLHKYGGESVEKLISLFKNYYPDGLFQIDQKGSTPLHTIANALGLYRNKHYLILRSPLTVYKDVKDQYQRTPLHLAALRGNGFVCEELLLLGADPNAQNSELQTPLHIAFIRQYGFMCNVSAKGCFAEYL